jgi:hypothetical protein
MERSYYLRLVFHGNENENALPVPNYAQLC